MQGMVISLFSGLLFWLLDCTNGSTKATQSPCLPPGAFSTAATSICGPAPSAHPAHCGQEDYGKLAAVQKYTNLRESSLTAVCWLWWWW